MLKKKKNTVYRFTHLNIMNFSLTNSHFNNYITKKILNPLLQIFDYILI